MLVYDLLCVIKALSWNVIVNENQSTSHNIVKVWTYHSLIPHCFYMLNNILLVLFLCLFVITSYWGYKPNWLYSSANLYIILYQTNFTTSDQTKQFKVRSYTTELIRIGTYSDISLVAMHELCANERLLCQVGFIGPPNFGLLDPRCWYFSSSKMKKLTI